MTSDIVLNEKDTRANHLLGLFNALSQLSEVYLFVPKNHKKQYNSHIHYVSRFDTIYPVRVISYEVNMFIKLFLFCINERIGAIYHRQSGLNISPLIISRIFRIPFFVEVNGLLVNQANMTSDSYRISKLQLKVSKLSEKLNYKYSTKIIAVAEGIKRGIIKSYYIPPEKVIVIQNGADSDLFKPLNKKDVIFDFNFDVDCKYVGFVGSFAPWHGLENLVNSAPLVLSEYPDMKYVLIGNGGLKEKIHKMINDLGLKDNFIFVDRVPHEEVPKYINIFDVCTILKDKNIPGSPLKLAEYMACGKPIIATNSEDFEVLKEINAGILVDPENSEEVCRAIVTLLKDDSLRYNMGIKARKYVVKNRSWKSTAQEVYNEILCYI
ncbi:glycosyltransferase family 4 protein [Methanosarcina mazei]|nr:glycosyltransferase family 4 protein [Methanosarcina mazei]